MLKIYPNGISVTKGDTVRMPIDVTNNDGTKYTVQTLDTIHFGLKEKYEDDELLIELTIDNTDLELVIPHEKTKDLEVGKSYVWDIQLTKENGDVHTFMNGKLKVTEEVYDK